jgi:hypothetical protein
VNLAQRYIGPALPYAVLAFLLAVVAGHHGLVHLLDLLLPFLDHLHFLLERAIGLLDRRLGDAIAHFHQCSGCVLYLPVVSRLPARIDLK